MPAAPAEQRGEAQGSHQAIVRSPQVPQRLRSFSAGEPSAPMPGSCGTGRTMLVTHPQPLAHPSPPRRDAPAPPFPTIQLPGNPDYWFPGLPLFSSLAGRGVEFFVIPSRINILHFGYTFRSFVSSSSFRFSLINSSIVSFVRRVAASRPRRAVKVPSTAR